MIECVVNVSEGRDAAVLEALDRAAGDALMDRHTDADHHRSVLTLAGVDAVREVARAAVDHIDLRDHRGAHPRIGAVDVVPFVPLGGSSMTEAVAARDEYARWSSEVLRVPCFRYGPSIDGPHGAERTLPQVRAGAFSELAPDEGPDEPHATAGATAVGARPPLVAFNVWLAEPDLVLARELAGSLRGPAVRALGLQVGSSVQVSMNLVDPTSVGPAQVTDAVAARAAVERCELVGLLPRAVLARVPRARWAELDLGEDRTIEARWPS